MRRRDVLKLLSFEMSSGRIRRLTPEEIDEVAESILSELDASDYYNSLDPNSDAAMSYADDIINEQLIIYNA